MYDSLTITHAVQAFSSKESDLSPSEEDPVSDFLCLMDDDVFSGETGDTVENEKREVQRQQKYENRVKARERKAYQKAIKQPEWRAQQFRSIPYE